MIKRITVTNPNDETLTLDLRNPEASGFAIVNIEGLTPNDATINMSSYASIPGSSFNSTHIDSRNIVLTLKLMEYPTIGQARLLTYQFFPVTKLVKLTIETDLRNVEIMGYVESNPCDIFSSSVHTQISIVCPDPYFYAVGDGNHAVFSGVEPKFEFPFCNDSVSDNLLICSEIKTDTWGVVANNGDAEIGMIITLDFIGNAQGITIYKLETGESIYIDTTKIKTLTGTAIGKSDRIIISTIQGVVSATLLRSGVYTNIINCISQDSDWFLLNCGDNTLAYVSISGEENIMFQVDSCLAYEGV